MNQNLRQILQARSLESFVKGLCSFDRRAAHPDTEAIVHYLWSQLEKEQLIVKLHKAVTVPFRSLNQGIEQCVSSYAKNNFKAREDRRAKLAGLKLAKDLDIVNLFTRIGNPNGKKIIVGAHYDMDLFLQKGAGADDNASGVATLLQLAKNLKDHESKFAEAGICIEIVFFGAEEQPFNTEGSSRYAQKLSDSSERDKLKLMINLDMVGFFDDNRDLDIWLGDAKFSKEDLRGEFLKNLKRSLPKKENYYVVQSYQDEDRKLAQLLSACMRDQSLVTEHLSPERLTYVIESDNMTQSHSFCPGISDHDSFVEQLIPTIFVSANPHRNKNYHTNCDTPETLDYMRMSKLTDSLERFLLSLTEESKP